MAARSVDIILAAKDRASKTFSKVGGATDGLKSKLLGLKSAIGAAVAGYMTFAFAKQSIADFGVQEQAEAKLAAVIKATGGAAGRTAEQLKQQAAALQQVTTFGDEAIINGQAILATFRQIKGDHFDEATTAALNMATVLDTDLKSATIMIGKALNDPTTGMTAMTRAGITFTDQQKDMVKQLQASGDMMGAQDIVLKELEMQFGGAAEAMANTTSGKLKQFSNALGDLRESVGAAIAPMLGRIAGILQGAMPIIQDWIARVSERFYSLLDFLQPVFDGIKDIFRLWWEYMQIVFEAVSGIIGTFVGNFEGAGGAIQTVVDWVKRMFMGLATGGIAAWTMLETVITNWRDSLELVFHSAALAIVTWVEDTKHQFTVVVPAYFEWFTENLRNIVQTWWSLFSSFWSNAGKNIANFGKSLWSFLKGDDFDFEWTGLLEGFENTMTQLPEIADREITGLEEELASRVNHLADGIAGEFNKKFSERMGRLQGAFEQEADIAAGEPKPGTPGKPAPFALALEPESKDLIKQSQKAAGGATLEQSRFLTGVTGRDPQEQALREAQKRNQIANKQLQEQQQSKRELQEISRFLRQPLGVPVI